MIKEEIKFIDSTYFEGLTSIRAIIKGIDSGVNNRTIEKIFYDKSKARKNAKELGYFKAVSSIYGFELIETDSDFLDKISLGSSHGGIIAKAGERTLPSLSDSVSEIDAFGFYAMINGIEDPYNFGYALRSLYACGCCGIILGERNWMSAAGIVSRSSAGASEMFKIYRENELCAIDILSKIGFKIVCAEEKTDNILGECDLPCPMLLVVGGEKRGISRAVLDKADLLVKIPYSRDFRASLSAASATTMFAYEIMRQKNIKNKL